MRQQLVHVLVMFACGALLAGCSQPPPSVAYMKDPDALKRGKGLFVGSCGAYCHSASKDNRDAPYLFDCEWLHGGSDENIFNTISHGVPTTRMVGFAGKLPDGDNDIWKIVAYLHSAREHCG
jgi:mono/diheme cytochrome c family protein